MHWRLGSNVFADIDPWKRTPDLGRRRRSGGLVVSGASAQETPAYFKYYDEENLANPILGGGPGVKTPW